MVQSSVTVVMTGDEARLVASQRRAAAAQRQLTDAASGTARASRDSDASLKAFAASMQRINATPLERASSRMGQLRTALQRGYLDQTTYNRAVGHTVRELSRQSGMSQRAAADQLGVSRSFAASRISMENFAAAATPVFAGLTVAAMGFSKVMAEIRQQAQEAGEMLSGMADAGGQLAQLDMTVQGAEELRELARTLFRGGATTTTGAAGLREANQMVFQLSSAGLLEDAKLFGKIAAARVVQPQEIESLATAVNTLNTTIGRGEIGTTEQLMGKAVMASTAGPATMAQILKGASRAGAAAGAMGLSDEEVLAATGLMSAAKGSAEEGGTRLASLIRSLGEDEEQRFAGLNLGQAISAIDAMKLSSPDLQKMLGREEAVETYRILSTQRQQYEALLGKVRAANEQDLVAQLVANNLANRDIAVDLGRRRAIAGEELGREELGVAKNVADAVKATAVSQTRDRSGTFMAGLQSVSHTLWRSILGDEAYLKLAGSGGRTGGVRTTEAGAMQQRFLRGDLNRRVLGDIVPVPQPGAGSEANAAPAAGSIPAAGDAAFAPAALGVQTDSNRDLLEMINTSIKSQTDALMLLLGRPAGGNAPTAAGPNQVSMRRAQLAELAAIG